VISDNAPQFKLVSTAITQQWRTAFKDEVVLDYMSTEGIKRSFTTVLAPWQGGFHERLVGMVKRCLRKCTNRKHFSLDQLITLLAENEAILGFTVTPTYFLATKQKLGTGDIDYHGDKDF